MHGHNPNPLSEFFFLGKDILLTVLDAATNVFLAQIGDSTSSVPDSDAAEMWGPIGLWARPALPTSGNASCQAIGIKGGNRDALIAYRDVRNSSIYGKLGDGETCVGASTGQARTLYKSDGSIYNVTTVGNTAGGTTFAIRQAPDGSYTIQAPNALFQMGADGSITLGNTTGGITIDAAGNLKVFATAISIQGSAIAAISGQIATQLGPVPAVAGLGTIGVSYGSTSAPGVSTGSKNVVCSP